MKVSAHSMGTPHLLPAEAAELFASMGYDGVEFVSQDGHRSGVTVDWSKKARADLRRKCEDLRLPIVCLTAYMTDINAVDEPLASQQVALLRDSILLARDLGAPFVRLYGGRQVTPEEWHRSVDLVASRLRGLLDVCVETGVKIAIENHFGTLTRTAKETMTMVRAVESPMVGVLYDQANIAYDRGEECAEAIRMQAQHIFHVHAKDLEYVAGATESDVSEVTHLSAQKRLGKWVLLGRGVVPWAQIVDSLKDIGYDGFISVEYTYKLVYKNELPEPEIGMKQSRDFLKGLITESERPRSAGRSPSAGSEAQEGRR